MQTFVKENEQVSSFFVFFLVHSMQIGVGILGFERYIAKDAGYDAWISILLAGMGIHLVVWVSYKMLEKSKGDIIDVHTQLFGKWIGGALSFFFTIYSLVLTITVLRSFAEVVQVWVFQELSTWMFCAVFLVIVFSFVSGGFRVVTGVCFLSVIYGLPLLVMDYFPLRHAHFENLLPILDHSMAELLKASQTMTLSYIGFEMLFFYYPFIKHASASQRWAHYGVLYSTITYLITAVVCFVYYSEEQLGNITWATLMLWKIVDLPFVERFEYVGIAIWVTVVLSNLCLSAWGAYHGWNRLFSFSVNPRFMMLVLGFLVLLGCGFLTTRAQIDLLNSMMARIGFYFLYGYIPLLFLIQWMVLKVRGSQR
ncbi:spore germination protein (amino acid permease) [Bacillus fengqiuensis]|nr:spore germination protein (amino acid permease) [Bacillus fengqiuensis]